MNRYMAENLTTKDLPKFRFYEPNHSPPVSDDLDISSDNIDEFLGFDTDSDFSNI